MKFARTLEFNCVPEWSQYYLKYTALRKLIEQIAASSVQAEDAEKVQPAKPLTDVVVSLPDSHVSSLEASFESLFHEEVQKVADFYAREREQCVKMMEGVAAGEEAHKPYPDDAAATVTAEGLQGVYAALHDLVDYLQLNYTGFCKIIKKHDKYSQLRMKTALQSEVDSTLSQKDVQQIHNWISQVEKHYARLECDNHLDAAKSQLRAILRERLILERANVWQDMVAMERKVASVTVAEPEQKIVGTASTATKSPYMIQFIKLGVIVAVFLALWWSGIYADDKMNRAFALAILIVSLWATEALPLYASGLLVPFMIVLMRVLKEAHSAKPVIAVVVDTLDSLSQAKTPKVVGQEAAAQVIIAKMFSDTILLLLGGVSIAAAFTKYGIAKVIACQVIRVAGNSNGLLIFAIMLLTVGLSALISNVAAPVLCYSLLTPLFRGLPTGSSLTKQLILAVSVAANIGGAISPISSPQNAIGISVVGSVGWPGWLLVSIPVCFSCIALCWAVIFYSFSRAKAYPSNMVYFTSAPIKWGVKEITIVATVIVTVLLWCVEQQFTIKYLGKSGIVALLPMIVFFGFGILGKDDLSSFPWPVVILAMSGSAFGKALESSGLLEHSANMAATYLRRAIDSTAVYSLAAVVSLLVTIITCFISHTVGASVFVQIMYAIGNEIGGTDNLKLGRLLAVITTLACSAGMMMPASSFPNIAATSQEDAAGRRYLSTGEFIKICLICSVAVWIVLATLGAFLVNKVLC